MHTFKFIRNLSDIGTEKEVLIKIDDKELEGVTRVVIESEVGGLNKVSITILVDKVDVEGNVVGNVMGDEVNINKIVKSETENG